MSLCKVALPLKSRELSGVWGEGGTVQGGGGEDFIDASRRAHLSERVDLTLPVLMSRLCTS